LSSVNILQFAMIWVGFGRSADGSDGIGWATLGVNELCQQ